MRIKRKFLKFMVAILAVTVVAPFQFSNTNALEGWIDDSSLTSNGTQIPANYGPIPDAFQYQYQKEELAAFCHFGPNTFNEIEWGENYGNRSPADIFKLTADDQFDAETLVKTLKDAGFKRLIVTAKHHDGFCIWDSEYTDYDVTSTNYKGDVLEEISTACTKYDMDMGLYLSPWDIHDKSYGYFDKDGKSLVDSSGQPANGMTWEEVEEKDVYDYNEYYDNQLQEILGNDKYGNNGEFIEVWMDGAKGSGYKTQNYNFEKWFNTIQKNEGKLAGREADCLLFGSGAKTTVRWIGNEHGEAPDTNWAQCKLIYDKNGVATDVDTGWNEQTGFSAGYQDGDVWTVPECDARITSGWFWGTQKKTPKTMEELSRMYFQSVGHNATLLLNVPPNNKGKMDTEIVDRIVEFGNAIKDTFRTNEAKGGTVYADSVLGNDSHYSPSNVLDGDQNTYWTTHQNNKGSLLLDLKQNKKFDVVSIEETIQKGQRIEKYKVEYSQDGNEWKTIEEGTTIGSKRLIRTGTINARYVKITVETPQGTVPLISEVGLYKATGGLEQSVNIPEGMEIIDNTDKDISDGVGFTNVSSGWTDETGIQFLNQTNMWASANQTFDIKFNGTKIYLIGTVAPNHGKALVSIDGGKEVEINTLATSRKTGVKIFASEDLADGAHTLTLKTQGLFGVEGAAVINNGGKGMLEFEQSSYRVLEAENENNTLEHKIKVIRVGGTLGEMSANVENNPGTAMQGNYDASNSGGKVLLTDGESFKEVSLYTKYDSRIQGDTSFSMNLVDGPNIIGFQKDATIVITDRDVKTKTELSDLVTASQKIVDNEHLYKSGIENFIKVIEEAQSLIDRSTATHVQYGEAYRLLTNATQALVKRENYTDEDRFNFPLKESDIKIAEIEFGKITNVSNTSPDNYPIQKESSDWASNGQLVSCVNPQDTIEIPYFAARTGTYEMTLTYGNSGNPLNGILISEKSGNITPTAHIAAGSDNPTLNNLTVKFDVEIVKEGNGTLIITGGPNKASGLDKLTVKPKDVNYKKYTVASTVEGHGSIALSSGTGPEFNEFTDVSYSIIPNNGYKIVDVLIDGVSVGPVSSYTFKNIQSNGSIKAIFEFAYYNQTEPFVFPSEIGTSHTKILEAELTELLNSGGDNEEWKLGVESRDWASNGKVVNCFNNGDKLTIYFNAEKTGMYNFVATYRSGSVQNALKWYGDNIESGSIVAGSNSADQTKTVEFTINVKKAGQSSIVFEAPVTNSPILDKFDISYSGNELTKAQAELKIVIDAANDEIKKTDVYKQSSIDKLKEAIIVAQNIYDNESDIEVIKTAKTTLQIAIDSLETIVKKEELKKVLEEAKIIVDSIHTYSPNSILGLENNFKEGQRLFDEENATQSQIDSITMKIQINIDNAKKKADVDDLVSQVETAKKLDMTTYTKASVKVFNQVLDSCEELLAQELTFKNQAEIDLLSSRLLKATHLLTLSSDLEKDEFIDPEGPVIKDVELINPDKSITVSGKLPEGIQLSSSTLNQKELGTLIELIKKMNPSFLDNVKLEKVYDLKLLLNNQKYNGSEDLVIKLKLDSALLNNKLAIIYIDDFGRVQVIDSKVENGYIIFTTNHFSSYGIISYRGETPPIVKPSQPSDNIKPGDSDVTKPSDKVQTADTNSSSELLVILCSSLLLLSLCMVSKRKESE